MTRERERNEESLDGQRERKEKRTRRGEWSLPFSLLFLFSSLSASNPHVQLAGFSAWLLAIAHGCFVIYKTKRAYSRLGSDEVFERDERDRQIERERKRQTDRKEKRKRKRKKRKKKRKSGEKRACSRY